MPIPTQSSKHVDIVNYIKRIPWFESIWTAGWWFGKCFIFPYIGNNHPNWLIFYRGVGQPPTRQSFPTCPTMGDTPAVTMSCRCFLQRPSNSVSFRCINQGPKRAAGHPQSAFPHGPQMAKKKSPTSFCFKPLIQVIHTPDLQGAAAPGVGFWHCCAMNISLILILPQIHSRRSKIGSC